MPTPAQLREQRINQLYESFKGKNTDKIDTIYRRALELFPMVTKHKAMDYSETVYRMLQTKKEV